MQHRPDSASRAGLDDTLEHLTLDIAGELEQLARHEAEIVRRRRQLRSQGETEAPSGPRRRAAPTRPSWRQRLAGWLGRGR